MSRYCIKCGTQLPDNAVFCSKCGSRQPELNAPRSQQSDNHQNRDDAKSKPAQQAPRNAAQKTNTRRQDPAVPNGAQPKKKSGCLTRLVALLLVAALIYTGFVNPGFFRGKTPGNIFNDVKNTVTDVKNTVSNIVNPSNKEDNVIPGDLSGIGNSREIASSPCEGVYVTAPKDAFLQDTEIKMQPITEADETLLNTVSALEEEGIMAIAGWEVDAGLDDDEVIPGTYTVSIDLSTLDIDESLYDHLVAYRIADDGTYYQYASRIENGKLVYSSDQNSITLLAVVKVGTMVVLTITMIAMWAKNLGEGASGPIQYFQDAKTKESHITRSNGYAEYTLRWANKDLGIDDEEIRKKMNAIEEKYKAKSDELYKEYEKTKYDNATSILNIFSRNKSVEEVVAEAIKSDTEYQKLVKEMALPEPVEYAVSCIDMAFKFLKDHEYIKMPSAVVEITSAPGLPSNVLGLAMPRLPKYPWVHIDLSKIVKGGQEKRDELLLTLTHELLHVCQRGYRYFWTDSVRYDEMTAIVVENRAADWYKMEGIIDYDSTMEMCPVDHWGLLKLPIDKFYAEAGNNTTVMQNEGYNLGLFVDYLVDKTGKIMWGERLMREACSYKEGGLSKQLMKAFGLNEAEFETYYKLWIRNNKQKFADYYIQRKEAYKPNDPVAIEKGGQYSVQIVPEGSYTSEIRTFKQKSQDPMILLMVPDGGFSSDLPGTQLVPVDKFELFTKGVYIPALDERGIRTSQLNRFILEITGILNNPGDRNGYTVYVLDKTRPASCSEDDDDLIMKFPDLSKPASAKIIDGYLLTILTPGGGRIEKEISNSCFKSEYRIAKKEFEELFEDEEDEELKLSFTLCEYVKNGGGDKLFGEVSDEFSFTIHRIVDYDLSKFDGMWIPVEIEWEKAKGGDWCLGLIYVKDYNEFGEYEGYIDQWNTAKSRWLEIKYFDYDPKTGVLTIDFEKNAPDKATGTATFRINGAGNLEMTNSGGTFVFYRAPND